MATTTDRPDSAPRPRHAPPRPPRRRVRRDGHPRPRTPPGLAERRLATFSLRAALLVFIGLAAIVAGALVLALGLRGGEAPPATGAAELVPANALLYLHVSTDPSRPAVGQALAVGRKLPAMPALVGAVTDRVGAMLGGSAVSVSFSRDIRPWLGREAALAVLDTPGPTAGSLVVLDVRNRARARRFLFGAGARPEGAYHGVALLAQPSGTTLAFVRHYLVLGQVASVRQAIDVGAGRMPSLAASARYRRAAATEPDARILDAYASVDGIRRALAPQSGLLGELGTLLDQPGLSAATIAVSPDSHGLQILVHRTLDPRLASRSAHSAAFTPTLARVIPAGSALLVDVRNLAASAPKLLAFAAKAGVAGRIAPLLSRLGSGLAAQGVNLGQLLGMFGGETAIALTPGQGASGPAPVIVTRTNAQTTVRALLAELELPLSQLFAPSGSGAGEVPQVSQTTVSGVAVRQLSVAPGLNLDYAVGHGLLVVSTGRTGISEVFRRARSLDGAASLQSVVSDSPGRVGSLVFLDPSQLLRLGLRLGLIGGPREAALWPSAERIRAVALASWRGAEDTTTELQLQIP
ncbi:MAG TPA: DUF3352 domain-containing protein [Solirubrobacteraceae bacterium]|nr:DUF3352 domain-containing protein [Solirubrobacteraceae bacterium]